MGKIVMDISILQFMIQKHKVGIVVFNNTNQLKQWLAEYHPYFMDNYVFWLPHRNAYRFESTMLYLLVARDWEDYVQKTQAFDRGLNVWFPYGQPMSAAELKFLLLKNMLTNGEWFFDDVEPITNPARLLGNGS